MQFDIGAVLKLLRTRMGWSQEKLAEQLNMARTCISKIESGKQAACAETMIRWTTATNAKEVMIAYLYGMDGISIMQNILNATGVA